MKKAHIITNHSNLASCIVATLFLILITAVIVTVYISVYKPKDPKVSVNAVNFPTFSISNRTVNFTFSQNVSVKNPNRDAFTHYDSSLELVYAGEQVGFMFIPAGEISAGGTQHMSATFSVSPFLVTVTPFSGVVTALGDVIGGIRMGPTLEVESRLKMVGRVRVLRFFMHRVESRKTCSVVIEVGNGSLLGFHC